MHCYILIGGRSQRMGESKVGLFLPRVAAAAREAFEAVFAVQRFGGPAADGVEMVYEPAHEESAPAFGLLAALEHARARCVVLAVDYPGVTTDLLRLLADRTETAEAPIVAPRWDGRLQPLFAGYDAGAVAPRLASRIAAGRLDLLGLIAEVGAEAVEDLPVVRNVNTPEELQEAMKQV